MGSNSDTVKTTVVDVTSDHYDEQLLDEPARALRDGKLVGFPTETVYGIAANEQDETAVSRLLNAKNNDPDKKLTVHIGSMDEFRELSPNPPPLAARLAARFWPGPLTMVLPHPERETVGLRMPDHRVALDLLRKAQVHVVASSANLNGEAPALTAEDVRSDFEGTIEYIVDGGPVEHGTSSTVIKVDRDAWTILREGALSPDRIREEEGCQILFVCTGNTCRSPMAARLFREMVEEHQDERSTDITVRSAGVSASDGNRAADTAERVMQEEYGLSLSDHRTTRVTPELIRQSDHVFVMQPHHESIITEELPDLKERIQRLGSGAQGIDDPVGGTYETYKQCAEQIRTSLRSLLPTLL